MESLEKRRGNYSLDKHLKTESNDIPSDFSERLKTEKEIILVDISRRYIEEQIRDLGLDVNNGVDTRVVILKPKTEKVQVGVKRGGYLTDKDIAYVYDIGNLTGNLCVLQHEMIHAYSYQDYVVNRNVGGKVILLSSRKSGYRVNGDRKKTDRFRGLNEMVVERLNREIMGYILSDDSIDGLEQGDVVGGYEFHISLLEIIIKRIAEQIKLDFDDVWNMFKKGLFDGSVAHLRLVDKVFGPGSLRVLSSLDSCLNNNIKTKEDLISAYGDILKFFSDKLSFEERDKLAGNILSDADYYKFNNINNSLKNNI